MEIITLLCKNCKKHVNAKFENFEAAGAKLVRLKDLTFSISDMVSINM